MLWYTNVFIMHLFVFCLPLCGNESGIFVFKWKCPFLQCHFYFKIIERLTELDVRRLSRLLLTCSLILQGSVVSSKAFWCAVGLEFSFFQNCSQEYRTPATCMICSTGEITSFTVFFEETILLLLVSSVFHL